MYSEFKTHNAFALLRRTMGRYGKRYQPKVLLDALVKLDYDVDIPKWNML